VSINPIQSPSMSHAQPPTRDGNLKESYVTKAIPLLHATDSEVGPTRLSGSPTLRSGLTPLQDYRFEHLSQ
jgi:hypothetical protein